MIKVSNLSLTYPKSKKTSEVVALKDISCAFNDDSFTVILGASGSGKTSLLHCIAGLLKYSGEVSFDGVDAKYINIADRNLSLVNQQYVLYPHMSIFDNIAFPLKAKGCEKKEIIEEVYKVAEILNISFLLTRKPKELSGGQQQRVALARAMVKKPKIYLFDEPLSNVGAELRDIERQMIKKAVSKYHSTAIYVTHNIKEATALADHIIVMDEGKIVFEGNKDELMNSHLPIVRELMVASNVL